MFDNQKKDPQLPEDIFSSMDQVADQQLQPKNETISNQPEVFANNPFAPNQEIGVATQKTDTISDLPASTLDFSESKKNIKKYLIIGGIFIFLVLIIFAAVNLYKTFTPKLKEGVKNVKIEMKDTKNTNNQTSETKNNNNQPAVNQVDTDQDGLTDEEETKASTNKELVDTDNDGLSDREEVKVYETNPTNADTDGDGYLDGQEVKNGYNPKGSGKLYQLPTKK